MRSWKISFFFLCILMAGVLVINSSAFGQAKPQAKTFEFTYSIFFPASHKKAVVANDWAREIEKRSKGRVKITVHPGATLTQADKIYDGVVNEISDIGAAIISYTRGKFPLTEGIDLPLGYKSGLASTTVFNDYLKKFKPKEFNEVKVFYGYGNGPGFIHTKKPVNKMEDLKGMKIRSTGLGAKIISALGATPVAMVLGETYDALSRGVVDGLLVPFDALAGWKLAEVVKYHAIGYGISGTATQLVVMNKDKWNSLPPDLQKIIEDVNEEWIEKEGRTHDETDQLGKDLSNKLGNKMIYLSKEEDERWAKAVRPLFDEYVKSMKAKGLPGDEVLKFCLNRLKTL